MRWHRNPMSKTEQYAVTKFRGPWNRVYSARWRVFRQPKSARWSLCLDAAIIEAPDETMVMVIATGPDVGFLKRRADQAAYTLGHLTPSEAQRLSRSWARSAA